jgi:hypothetical protein
VATHEWFHRNTCFILRCDWWTLVAAFWRRYDALGLTRGQSLFPSLSWTVFLIGIVGGGVQLGPLGTAATNTPIVPAPGVWWWRNWWNNWQRKLKYSEKTCPSAALTTINPTCCPDANPSRRGGKSATNRLSYGTAFSWTFARRCLVTSRGAVGFLWGRDCIFNYSLDKFSASRGYMYVHTDAAVTSVLSTAQ